MIDSKVLREIKGSKETKKKVDKYKSCLFNEESFGKFLKKELGSDGEKTFLNRNVLFKDALASKSGKMLLKNLDSNICLKGIAYLRGAQDGTKGLISIFDYERELAECPICGPNCLDSSSNRDEHFKPGCQVVCFQKENSDKNVILDSWKGLKKRTITFGEGRFLIYKVLSSKLTLYESSKVFGSPIEAWTPLDIIDRQQCNWLAQRLDGGKLKDGKLMLKLGKGNRTFLEERDKFEAMSSIESLFTYY